MLLLQGLAVGFAPTKTGLTLSLFNNTALTGSPAFRGLVPTPNYTHAAGGAPFSALISGTLQVERGYTYAFECDFGGAVLGYVHIDGHLVCQTGANRPHPPAPASVISTAYDSPLPVLSATAWPMRFAIVHNGTSSRALAPTEPLTFGMAMTRNRTGRSGAGTAAAAAAAAAGEARLELVRDGDGDRGRDRERDGVGWLEAALSPLLPEPEVQRDALQEGLTRGWGMWYDMSYTKLVRLPEGSTLTVMLCDSDGAANTTRCVREARTDWGPRAQADVQLRLGPHAYDRSFAQLYLATHRCNVSLSMRGGDELLLLLEVVAGCGETELVITGGAAWYRVHTVRATASSLFYEPYGDGVLRSQVRASALSEQGALALPADVAVMPHLRYALAPGRRLGFASGELAPISGELAPISGELAPVSSSLARTSAGEVRISADAIGARLEAAARLERGRYAAYGEHAEVKEAVQAAVMWNVVYNPIERVIAPVIRGNPWGWDPATTGDDWPYVLFDWDTHFAAYMLSLDARELGYSVLIQVVKAKTAQGFVPNGYAPTRKSTHSQPPVGSKVLLEMYRKYRNIWLVELLFDDLLDWSNWFYDHRRLAPLNLTALGGDDMQAARYESGLDDSPMYDGDFFNATGSRAGYGLMQMYDVGMASMVAMSDASLAELADAIGRQGTAAALRRRAAEAGAKIDAHLWDDASGTFVNRFPSGGFNRRVSPTSFYPMMAGVATEARAASMMSGWLLNSSRFCVAPSGDFKGNSETCYWGLPSISADDAAFPPLGYWRGFVWGPMALLTYWGLAHPAYAAAPLVAVGRRGLCGQMGALFLSQWRAHRHVCENFSPWRNATECTGMHFYHWGGLAGFIGLLDAGFY